MKKRKSKPSLAQKNLSDEPLSGPASKSQLSKWYSKLGRKGMKARQAQLTKAELQEIRRRGGINSARKRWGFVPEGEKGAA